MPIRDESDFDQSRAMNVLCWNCQGIENYWTVQGLKGLIALNLPSVIFLSETRCTVDEMVKICHQLGWHNVFSVVYKFVAKKRW